MNITTNFNRFFSFSPRAYASRKTEAAVSAFFLWALSRREVQEKVADLLSSNSPLCRVLHDVVENSVSSARDDLERDLNREIESQVESVLESQVEHALERFEPEARNINGLDRAITDAVESALEDHEVNVDNITGLTQYVETSINEARIETDQIDGLEEMICETIAKKLNN